MRSTWMVIFAFLVIGSIVLVACATPEPEVLSETVVVSETATETVTETATKTVEVVIEIEPKVDYGPVTFRGYLTSDVITMDPQLGEDSNSINYIENLFVHLTNYDLDNAEIVPEAAASWEISEDGLTYTFMIRNDIPWVKYNASSDETIQDVDEDGIPRFVTAHDFVYGIQRACRPDTSSLYSSIIASNIVGCKDVLSFADPENIPEQMVDAIGVSAPDNVTLVIELPAPAAYFLSMTSMWTITATPSWAIEEHGDEWTEPGNIVTNGRFVLEDMVHDTSRSFIRNPLMPVDMQGSGNIERFEENIVPDGTTGYALWLDGEVETSGIPSTELEAHLAEFGDETVQVPDLAVFYIAFRMTKAPFDNVHVRRAFSAAFDRDTFATEIRQGQALPMIHFAPPGIFGAPPINEVGVGFNVEYAQEQLTLAGYPNCEGFPQVSLLGYSGSSTLNWITFAQSNWTEYLGCSPDIITIEQQSFGELLRTTELDDDEAPNMWTLGWGPDYADENNWVGDILSCETALRMKRECNEIDEKIDQARTSTDPAERIALYSEIEDMFFGEEGEFPFMPLFLRIAFVAEHSWLTRTPALFGGDQWYNWSIDQNAQMTAQQ